MKVFISYRREDSAGHTGRLYDFLRPRLGEANVFLDLSGIDSGRKFADVIQGAIHDCDVLLAIIGPEWLTCVANGRRRLDDPADLVRTEILTALNGNIPIIPVLVGGATPPTASALPAPLQPLAALDAHDMTDERWAYDADRLVQAIERLGASPGRRTLQTSAVVPVALVLLLLVVGGFFVWRGRDAGSLPKPKEAGGNAMSATTRPDGEWSADVRYDWGAQQTERLLLKSDGTVISGTASFLGVPRGIVNGTQQGDRIAFETRTEETSGDFSQTRTVIHRYRGRLHDNSIDFSMQSDGTASTVPIEFTATRRSRP